MQLLINEPGEAQEHRPPIQQLTSDSNPCHLLPEYETLLPVGPKERYVDRPTDK